MPPLTHAANPHDQPPPQSPSRPARPDDRTPSMLDWALRYAALDWPVLPLHSVVDGRCTCGDAACDNVGKHPRTRHGKNDGTTDEETIRSWWTAWPDANIGAVVPEGHLVFDIDPRHGGHPTALAPTPSTVMAKSGGGGYHLYFSTAGVMLPERLPATLPGAAGIDLRAAGKHYLVLPPSLHRSGRRYTWVTSPLDDSAAAPLPDHLAARLRERPTPTPPPATASATGSADSPATFDGPIGPGERNTRLASIAGSLRRQGLPEDTIAGTLQRINEEHCEPPLDREEVAAIARSVARYRPEPLTAAPRQQGEEATQASGRDIDQRQQQLASPPQPLSAQVLMAKAIPDLQWVVPDLLPEGAFLLGGKEKVGKSWLVYDLALAVATGGTFLGTRDVLPGEVLYLALEDSERRLKNRLETLLGADVAAPGNLYLCTEWRRLDAGGERDLDEWLGAHPDARLVILDTFELVRRPGRAKANAYSEDYLAIQPLSAWPLSIMPACWPCTT